MKKTPFLALKLIRFSTSYDVAISGNPISNYFFAWGLIDKKDIGILHFSRIYIREEIASRDCCCWLQSILDSRIMENDLFGTSTIISRRGIIRLGKLVGYHGQHKRKWIECGAAEKGLKAVYSLLDAAKVSTIFYRAGIYSWMRDNTGPTLPYKRSSRIRKIYL